MGGSSKVGLGEGSAWEARSVGQPAPFASVNISCRQLHDPQLASTIEEPIAVTQVPPARLVLEITENGTLVDTAVAVEIVRHLKQLGVGIALDDFGTGFFPSRTSRFSIRRSSRSAGRFLSTSTGRLRRRPAGGDHLTRSSPRHEGRSGENRDCSPTRAPPRLGLRPWPGLPILARTAPRGSCRVSPPCNLISNGPGSRLARPKATRPVGLDLHTSFRCGASSRKRVWAPKSPFLLLSQGSTDAAPDAAARAIVMRTASSVPPKKDSAVCPASRRFPASQILVLPGSASWRPHSADLRAREGIRTPDLLITSELLYRLSYPGIPASLARLLAAIGAKEELRKHQPHREVAVQSGSRAACPQRPADSGTRQDLQPAPQDLPGSFAGDPARLRIEPPRQLHQPPRLWPYQRWQLPELEKVADWIVKPGKQLYPVQSSPDQCAQLG